MTGEGLGCKPKVVEHAKFDYSPLGKVFNKGMTEDDQEEEPLKRVKKKLEIKTKSCWKQSMIKKQKSQAKKIVRQIRLKTIWFMILIAIFTNTDWVNFLKYDQLNLNLIP